MFMDKNIVPLENITALVKPLAEKYHVREIYLFGSYARGEADEDSDMDFLVFGGEGFKLTSILALGEDLRAVLKKKVDVFEIREINQDSEFFRTIMREKVLVA
jgi:predicted nucleotidyltransferase